MTYVKRTTLIAKLNLKLQWKSEGYVIIVIYVYLLKET